MTNFSAGQLIRLWVIYILTSTIAFMLPGFLKFADYQGWLAMIGAYLFSLFLAYFVVRLIQVCQQGDFIQSGKKLLGKPLHAAFLVLIVLYCLSLNTINIYEFTDFMGIIYLQSTPSEFLSFVFISCALVSAYLGLKSIVYLSDVFFIFLVFSILTTSVLFLKYLEPEMSIALLTHFELPKFIYSSYFVTNWIGDFVLGLFFFSSFNTKEKPLKTLAIAHGVVIGIVIFYWFLLLLLFGPHLGSHLRYPMLELIRYFEIGEFMENMDPLIVSLWSASLLLRSSLFFYITLKILSSLFPNKKRQRVIIPFIIGFVVWIGSTTLSNYPAQYLSMMQQPLGYFFIVIKCIPILYFIVYKLRFRNQQVPN